VILNDLFAGIGDTAGDAAGQAFQPLGNYLLQIVIILGVVVIMAVMVA